VRTSLDQNKKKGGVVIDRNSKAKKQRRRVESKILGLNSACLCKIPAGVENDVHKEVPWTT
jgi:hypothetical protein